MKQFPWREYFWVILLLSLAIGLAVELQRVRQLSEFRDQAVQTEAKARELAEMIAAATDSLAQFGSNPQYGTSSFNLKYYVGFEHVYFVAKDGSQRTVRSVRVPSVWRTDSRMSNVIPSITGMMDLDLLLVITPAVALMVWVASYPSYKHPPANYEFSLQMFWLVGPFHVLLQSVLCIFAFRGFSFGVEHGCMPYLGAFMLTANAIFVPRYFYLCGLTNEEHIRLIQETQGRLFNWEKLRPFLRFQLRDIFWLMLAIALASAIFTEHRRGHNLLPYRGTAQWWSNAVQALQEESDKLPAAR